MDSVALMIFPSGRGTPIGMRHGFIDWHAVTATVSTSIHAVPLGARLEHYLPRAAFQRIVTLVLALIGLRMVSG